MEPMRLLEQLKASNDVLKQLRTAALRESQGSYHLSLDDFEQYARSVWPSKLFDNGAFSILQKACMVDFSQDRISL